MNEDWKERLSEWSKPPTDHEEKKGSTAAEMIKEALRSYPLLQKHHFRVYPTGSYRNNTNVRLGSDIDIAVVLTDSFYPDLPPGLSSEQLGLVDASYNLDSFREHVGEALVLKFGSEAVTPGDKTFNVCESSKRLDADVTAFLQYRKYTGARLENGSWEFIEGAETRSRREPYRAIINWHEQHYENGVVRNEQTNRRFKRVTRILKRMRDEMGQMDDETFRVAGATPSFLIECLVYNAPDSCFNRTVDGYYADVYQILTHLWIFTSNDMACTDFVEVNGLKSLFSAEQSWHRADAHQFVGSAFRFLTTR